MYRFPSLKLIAIQNLNFIRSLSGYFKNKTNVNERASFLIDAPGFFRKIYFAKYCRLRQNPQLDEVVKQKLGSLKALEELRNKGIVRYPVNFSKEVASFKSELKQDDNHYSLAFSDSLPTKLYEDSGLIDFVSAYYGRQSFFRERPTIHFDSIEDYRIAPPPSDIFHSDGYRQISFMLLLADLDENNIHMEYCLKSHLRQQPTYRRERIDQEKVSEIWEILAVTGKAGDLFVFDTEGIHRGRYEADYKTRTVFHQNLHPGIYPPISEYAPHFIPENVSELTYRGAFGMPINS